MKRLLILNGLMGSGKSTFIKENKLEDFTLSSDELRIKMAGFDMSENGLVISQKKDRQVWASHNYDDGKYTTNDYDWAVYSTAYGDGVYDGGNYRFCVDAGAIGILPLELITDNQKLEEAKSLGFVIEGELSANFETDGNGCFDVEIYNKDNEGVKKFDINTGNIEEDEDEYQDEEWD